MAMIEMKGVSKWYGTFQVFEAFTAATILYLLINIVVVFGMRWVERKVSVPGLISAGGPPLAGH